MSIPHLHIRSVLRKRGCEPLVVINANRFWHIMPDIHADKSYVCSPRGRIYLIRDKLCYLNFYTKTINYIPMRHIYISVQCSIIYHTYRGVNIALDYRVIGIHNHRKIVLARS